MKEPKSNSEPAWMDQQRGEATEAFNRAVEGKPAVPAAAQTQRGSQMVQYSACGLHEGPPPPGLTRSAVTRHYFNQRWRAEGRGFRAMQWKLREEFNLKAGTIRNAVVSSDTRTPLLKSDFNRAAQVRRRRSR